MNAAAAELEEDEACPIVISGPPRSCCSSNAGFGSILRHQRFTEKMQVWVPFMLLKQTCSIWISFHVRLKVSKCWMSFDQCSSNVDCRMSNIIWKRRESWRSPFCAGLITALGGEKLKDWGNQIWEKTYGSNKCSLWTSCFNQETITPCLRQTEHYRTIDCSTL